MIRQDEPLYLSTYYELRKRIETLSFAPGEHLTELPIAETFKVSRTPVRKALEQLAQDGLVKKVHGRTIVTAIEKKEIQETMEIRAALEKIMVPYAVSNVTVCDIEHLTNVNEMYRKAIVESRVRDSVDADVEFHDLIYQKSENRVLLNSLRRLESCLYRYRMKAYEATIDRTHLIDEHEQIVNALMNRDSDQLEKAVLQHIRSLESAINAYLK